MGQLRADQRPPAAAPWRYNSDGAVFLPLPAPQGHRAARPESDTCKAMIRTSVTPLHVAAVTHPGMAGRQNEDRFAVSSYVLSEKDPTRSIFAIVSDGIGGHSSGEIAAEMAVETISRHVADSDGRAPLEILERA